MNPEEIRDLLHEYVRILFVAFCCGMIGLLIVGTVVSWLQKIFKKQKEQRHDNQG